MWEWQKEEAERQQKLRDKKMLNRRPARPLEFHAATVKPMIDASVQDLCTKRYHNHPNGCPNYGERDTCPPRAKLLPEVFDTDRDIWALWAKFDLAAHIERMREKQPMWGPRQLACCLYWQGTVRKFLREAVAGWLEQRDYCITHGREVAFTTCPEAMGVNVTATMKQVGVTLEWPPKESTRMVYLIGVAK